MLKIDQYYFLEEIQRKKLNEYFVRGFRKLTLLNETCIYGKRGRENHDFKFVQVPLLKILEKKVK